MTTSSGDQCSRFSEKLVLQANAAELVLQAPITYSDFNSTDEGQEEEEEEPEPAREQPSPQQSPDLALRTKSFQSDLNLLQYTGLSRNEYTSIWTRLESPSQGCVDFTLGEALDGIGDRKTYSYTKPILRSKKSSGEPKRIVHQSKVPRHSGILGVTRIPTLLVDPEALVRLGYSFIMEKERFEIAHALSQESISEIVEETEKSRATDVHTKYEDWEIVTLIVIVVIHHGAENERAQKAVSGRSLGSRASHDPAVVPMASSQQDQKKAHVDNLPENNSQPIRRTKNSRSLAGTSITGYHTSRSLMSRNSYKTAAGGPELRDLAQRQLLENSQYAQMLRSRDLWPVDPSKEQDWSGRGQHVEFTKSEYGLINDILRVQGILGSTTGTIVESVQCRRILLARKTITCNRKFTKEQAIAEVAHITRLTHAHILRVIGTYVIGRNLSILLYPVARYNLDEYLEIIVSASAARLQWISMVNSCRTFFACLCDTISYIHSMFTKHLDIKPHNILVRRTLKPSWSSLEYPYIFSIYIADFGVSRSYPREDLIETDGQVCFTRKYAAPEVVSMDKRGLPADIFSLGCVFLEMYIVLCDASTGVNPYHNSVDFRTSGAGYDKLTKLRVQDKLETTHTRRLQKRLETSPNGNSYQADLESLRKDYLPTSTIEETSNTTQPAEPLQTNFTGALKLIIAAMMSSSPRHRPTASSLRKLFVGNVCCEKGACQLEAEVNNSEDDSESG